MNTPAPEHQLHHLIFDDIERFIRDQELPLRARMEQVVPIPYVTTVGDVGIGLICLYRRTRASRGVGIPIQYTVRVGGMAVAAMTRAPQDPIYGMLRYRKDHLEDDLAQLRAVLTGPRAYREMTREEAQVYGAETPGLTKKRIRLIRT